MDRAKAFEQTKTIPSPLPMDNPLNSEKMVESCPLCGADECKEQPQAGTHCYSVWFDCGTEITRAVGHYEDVEMFDKKCTELIKDDPSMYGNVHYLPEAKESSRLKVASSPKDYIFMNIANEISKMSKCVSKQVGSVIVMDSRIISIGYNGTPKGWKNCNEIHDKDNFDRTEHHKFSENYEIHSELNALLFASKNSLTVDGATLYCTLEPCMNCIKNMCQSGIKRIVFRDLYDLSESYTDQTFDMLETVGISIERLAPQHPFGCT